MVIAASYPNYRAVFFGYLINAGSWGFWPVLYVSLLERHIFFSLKRGKWKVESMIG